MKSLTLAAAAALLIGVAPQTASAFNLSFVQDLLDDLGVNVTLPEVNVDLPPRAEQAVENALDRAEAALDGINIDVPQVNLPNVDQIVEDALDQARTAQANALSRAQSAIDNGLGEASGILDGVGVTLPNITLPNVSIPNVSIPNVSQIVDDALAGAQAEVDNALEQANSVLDGINVTGLVPDVDEIVTNALNNAQSEVDRALGRANSILDDLDLPGVLPDVDEIVGDALGVAESAVEDALGAADGVLDDVQNVLDGIDLGGVANTVEDALDQASGVIDEVLGDGGLLDGILSDLPVSLPSFAQSAIDSAFSRVAAIQLPVQAGVAIPEPGSVGLLSFGLIAAAWRQR